MTALDDAALLRRYAAEHSEEAFAELVRRHVGLVYACALRQVGGDAHLAQDVAQLTFTALARKAGALAERPVLGGWLWRTTQFAARDVVRTERRRRAREQEAHAMQESASDAGTPVEWEKLSPVLDAALGDLREADRDAVWLRFFEGRSFAEVGARLRLTENAARMRVERALGRLHGALARRGVTSTAAALGLALASHGGIAAPAGLAASVTTAVLAGGATGAGELALATAIFMSAKKIQLGLAAALVFIGTTGVVVQVRERAKMREEISTLRGQAAESAALREGNVALRRVVAEAESFRDDDAGFARLRDEVEALRGRLRTAEKSAPERASAGSGNRLPRPLVQAAPVYPPELQVAGIAGEVRLDLIVSDGGKAANVYASKSTRPEFEAAALEAARQWTFEPAVLGNGRKVNTHIQIPITFTPGRASGEPGPLQPVEVPAPQPADWF